MINPWPAHGIPDMCGRPGLALRVPDHDPDLGHDDRGREGADAWDGDEPLGGGTQGLETRPELLVEFGDGDIDRVDLAEMDPKQQALGSDMRPRKTSTTRTREKPGPDAAVTLAAAEAAQLGRIAAGADRQGRGHGGVSDKNATRTPQMPNRSITSSSGRYYPAFPG